jgi:quercetin dioxygenase-like cupin family protein
MFMQELLVPVKKKKWMQALTLLFYPVGVFCIWGRSGKSWMKWLYTILGLPLFLIVFGYLGILVFASFLPPLDRSLGNRPDKTVYNNEGNYSATFIKSGKETNGAYELVQVELEPFGGNDWHYHKTFVEQFTVLEGQVKIGRNGKEHILQKGETSVANKGDMHFFKNAQAQRSLLLVKITPASGLEKTIRVAYGLMNDGLLKNDMTENPWHMALLLGYSESYLPFLPSWVQEPLINAFAKIAQWKGEDKALYKYFK